MLWGLQDLNSSTGGQTCAHCNARIVLTTGPPRNSLGRLLCLHFLWSFLGVGLGLCQHGFHLLIPYVLELCLVSDSICFSHIVEYMTFNKLNYLLVFYISDLTPRDVSVCSRFILWSVFIKHLPKIEPKSDFRANLNLEYCQQAKWFEVGSFPKVCLYRTGETYLGDKC